jgi:hypothetical protein
VEVALLYFTYMVFTFPQVNINPPEWEGYTESTGDEDDLKLTDFENLILIKSFREEKVCKSRYAKILIIGLPCSTN